MRLNYASSRFSHPTLPMSDSTFLMFFNAILKPDLIGSMAATLTTASFIPQVVHTWRTRDVSGISLGMYSAFTAGVALWLVYGILMKAWPIIIANMITTSLAGFVLFLKIKHSAP
jgi:MtN3 and saliva related transmembrane protein